jgi:hypothetical protein
MNEQRSAKFNIHHNKFYLAMNEAGWLGHHTITSAHPASVTNEYELINIS